MCISCGCYGKSPQAQHHKITLYCSGGQKPQLSLAGPRRMRGWGWFLLKPWREPLPCPFSLQSCAPDSPRPLALPPSSATVIASSIAFEITSQAHLDNPGPLPHLKILNSIMSMKSLCHLWEHSQAQGSGPGCVWVLIRLEQGAGGPKDQTVLSGWFCYNQAWPVATSACSGGGF